MDHAIGIIFWHSGTDESEMNHRYGVEFLIKDLFKKYVKNVLAHSERIIILQLAGTSINMNLTQVYASTADKQNSDAAQCYEQLHNALRQTRKTKLT